MPDAEDPIKSRIISLFNQSVKGRRASVDSGKSRHDGSAGHWLERTMGLTPNSSNSPDFQGYEMKTGTRSKTTFGDWSPDYFIYKDKAYGAIGRDGFLRVFGRPNPEKENRYSWSGEPAPKIKTINTFGQLLTVDRDFNILVLYYYSKDMRADKKVIIPPCMQKEGLVIARWDRESIKCKLERKFNHKGWFKCEKDKSGIYVSIVFGAPLTFDRWIKLVLTGEVFFDSGMYEGNPRPYSQWRASNAIWSSMIVSTH
jgi:hypothetical protein